MLSHYLKNHIGQFLNDVISEQPLNEISILNYATWPPLLAHCAVPGWQHHTF